VAGLNRIHKGERFGNLHYWVRSGRTGRGIATRAAKLVCHFGIMELGLQRIGILVPEGNVASEHVAEKLGAIREGVLRNASRLHDRQMNGTQYSIIPSDMNGISAA
jgi:RimJ/RimL family protein N-acetyltransferase